MKIAALKGIGAIHQLHLNHNSKCLSRPLTPATLLCVACPCLRYTVKLFK